MRIDAGRAQPQLTTLMRARSEQAEWSATVGPYRALDYAFSLRTNDAALGCYFERLFGALRATTQPTVLYSLVDNGDCVKERYALYADDELLACSAAGSFVVARMLWHINRRAIITSSRFVILHAGGVGSPAGAMLFPARSGHGKSTLVAGLVRTGLSYLTDEAVAIDPESLDVQPFRKPISLSGRLLAELAPALDEDVQRRYVGEEWHLDPRQIETDAAASRMSPAFVIAPRYVQDANTALTKMHRAEALVTLAANSFNLHDHGETGFRALAAVVRRCECYRLVVGDLAEACELVLAMQSGRASAT
jgi:hypothetical protein